jgi:hypothetical protein
VSAWRRLLKEKEKEKEKKKKKRRRREQNHIGPAG